MAHHDSHPARSGSPRIARASCALVIALAVVASACATPGPRYRSERVYHEPSSAPRMERVAGCQRVQNRCLERAEAQRERCLRHADAGASCEGFERECHRAYDQCFVDAGGRIEITRQCVRNCQSLYRPTERYRPAAPTLEAAGAH